MPYYNLLQGIKNTPLVEMPLKWYNLVWSGLYLFRATWQEKIYVKPFGTPIPGGFSHIENDFAEINKIIIY